MPARAQKCHGFGVGDPSSAGRHHRFPASCELPGQILLQLSEVGLAVSLENLGNGRVGFPFDLSVEVDEWPIEELRRGFAYGRFPRTGKADKNDVAHSEKQKTFTAKNAKVAKGARSN